ncbi:MAG: hypothetical protein J6O73_05420 [Lachnospiraceae bacterium]|nr:hypothetical protein [Lachnospiraceae bacterium]
MKVLKKVYYRIKFTLSSPLAVGSGENENADKDIVRDASGKPYIPASSIAGVARTALKNKNMDSYLGNVIKADVSNQEVSAEDSMILFYDAIMEHDQKYSISVRDCVGLDQYKTAKEGAKFDMEVLEPGPIFVTFIEQNITELKRMNVAGIIADLFKSNKFCFGGKTTRGYGDVSVSEIRQKEFDLQKPVEIEEWVSFDMYDESIEWDDYIGYGDEQKDIGTTITLTLKQKGGISIRKYSTKPGKKIKMYNGDFKKIPEPDYEQLTLSGTNPIPIIPGTSWAGAFGHQMRKLGLSERDYEDLFGYVKGNRTKKSLIRFSETQLENAYPKKMSRNAIDRFSGGAADGALFTERTYYDGNTKLKISVNGRLNDDQIFALSASISDLGYGFMAVGGLTAIGRGLFSIIEVNSKPVKNEEIFQTVKRILSGQEVNAL